MPEKKWITFTAGGHRFGIPIGEVREVLSLGTVVAVPGSKRPLEGILPYRDRNVLPVFSLMHLLGKADPERGNLVVVTGDPETLVGFRVESMGGVMTSSEKDEVVPYDGDLTGTPGTITGVLKKPGGELILLEMENLFQG